MHNRATFADCCGGGLYKSAWSWINSSPANQPRPPPKTTADSRWWWWVSCSVAEESSPIIWFALKHLICLPAIMCGARGRHARQRFADRFWQWFMWSERGRKRERENTIDRHPIESAKGRQTAQKRTTCCGKLGKLAKNKTEKVGKWPGFFSLSLGTFINIDRYTSSQPRVRASFQQ